MNTGLPIDYKVLSNFCRKFKISENKETRNEWKEKHAENCPKNVDGTSNATEVECAKRLWKRSIDFKLQYEHTKEHPSFPGPAIFHVDQDETVLSYFARTLISLKNQIKSILFVGSD